MSVRRNLLASLIAGGCFFAGTAGNLRAQYAQMQVPEATANDKGLGTVRSAATTAVRETGALSAASKDALKTYTEYLMAKMTEARITETSVETPDRQRANLMSSLVVGARSEEARATIAKAVVAKGTEIIDGNYSPQAKINAMLMLTEPRVATEALSSLYKYATASAVPAHLRSLALLGLGRSVQASIPPGGGASKMPAGQRDPLAKAMTEIIKSEPTSLREEKAHWWMVRRAFDVLVDLHAAGTASSDGAKQAMALFMEPTTLPSVRISAGHYLAHFDLAKADDATRNKILVSVAQFLDQEVVGWYEQEQDQTQAPGAGGYGGMGMAGMGMGMGMGAGAGTGEGYGAEMSTMAGYGAMGGSSGSGSSGPKPIETQKWDLRLARRKLNTYCQLAHVLLMGNGASGEKDMFGAKATGIMEADLPESLQRPGRKLLEALEKVQEEINDRTLTDVNSLMTRSVKSLDELRSAAEDVPGMTGADGAVLVPSFNELSPRKKSVKKADAKKTLDAPKTPEQMAAEQAAAAGAAAPAGDEAAAGTQPAAPNQPAPNQPAGNAAGANPPPANPPAGNPAAGNAPAGNPGQPNQPPQGGQPQPAANNPAAGNQPAANQ